MNSQKKLCIGAGGKKNRQKERRLMKGFNIASQPSSGTLPPVAEFIASLQNPPDDQPPAEMYGSTLSGIFNSAGSTKKHPHHISTNSVPGLSSGSKQHERHTRGSSRKRRWGNIIEAAKAGRMSKLIGECAFSRE